MDVRDSFKNATRAILAAKMRSFLTMLGIIIGIAAVILLMAVGNGSKQSILSRMQGSGSGNLYLTAGTRSNVLMGGFGGGGSRPGSSSSAKITLDDLAYLEENSTMDIVVSPVNQTNLTIKRGSTTMSGSGVFATTTYFEVEGVTVADGRELTQGDVDKRTRNVVIGATVASTLFPDESAVGQDIRLNGATYKVVGVAAEKGETMGASVDTS